MFDLCYKRHVRSGIAGILLQATDKGIKGEGGVQDALRGAGLCLQALRLMVFFGHFNILSSLGIDVLENRRRF